MTDGEGGAAGYRGLCAFVRHPQWRGLFVVLFGEGVVHRPTLFSVGLFPVIVAYYPRARKEERVVLARFGDEYPVYRSQVPIFIARWELVVPPDLGVRPERK